MLETLKALPFTLTKRFYSNLKFEMLLFSIIYLGKNRKFLIIYCKERTVYDWYLDTKNFVKLTSKFNKKCL